MRDILSFAVRGIAWLLGAWLLLTLAAVLALRWLTPPASAVMLQQPGGLAAVDYRWRDLTDISPYAARAVIAAEDQKFWQHNGFDVASIQQALADYRNGGRLRGASTISQQVAKNLFLWPGRSFARKGFEAYFTLLLETCWPKERILEVYLNVAELGPGVFGVGAAAERYFGKSAHALSPAEAALLAAVLPNPKQLRVEAPSAYVRQRQAWIERQMHAIAADGGHRAEHR